MVTPQTIIWLVSGVVWYGNYPARGAQLGKWCVNEIRNTQRKYPSQYGGVKPRRVHEGWYQMSEELKVL